MLLKSPDREIWQLLRDARSRVFVNLTNGTEWLDELAIDGVDWRYMRLQSTWCEQKLWEHILWTLPEDFLMAAALGQTCLVLDTSGNERGPRALWQGLEWVRYALGEAWVIGTKCDPNFSDYFSRTYIEAVGGQVLNRLKYYRRFLRTGGLHIVGAWKETERDGDYDGHVEDVWNVEG